jgi:antitoxin (DNA-binding transcriptional repressor) of toxin-antitoxin stability system
MAVIHISEAEAARDFAAVMDYVRAGAEVVIDNDASPVAVLRPATNPNLRRLSESLKMARARASEVTLDGTFERDLMDVINGQREPIKSEWD